MNVGLFFSGVVALALGVLFEILIRASRSRVYWRARVMIIVGTALIVAELF